jgi:hypothetical protein
MAAMMASTSARLYNPGAVFVLQSMQFQLSGIVPWGTLVMLGIYRLPQKRQSSA